MKNKDLRLNFYSKLSCGFFREKLRLNSDLSFYSNFSYGFFSQKLRLKSEIFFEESEPAVFTIMIKITVSQVKKIIINILLQKNEK